MVLVLQMVQLLHSTQSALLEAVEVELVMEIMLQAVDLVVVLGITMELQLVLAQQIKETLEVVVMTLEVLVNITEVEAVVLLALVEVQTLVVLDTEELDFLLQ